MKNAVKALQIMCLGASFVSFFFGISFYYRDLPNRPRPELGRIYPLNNHGYLLYLTRQEHLQQMWSGVLFVVLFAFFAVIDRFLDPFGQRSCKDLPRRRPPWNHRWGP